MVVFGSGPCYYITTSISSTNTRVGLVVGLAVRSVAIDCLVASSNGGIWQLLLATSFTKCSGATQGTVHGQGQGTKWRIGLGRWSHTPASWVRSPRRMNQTMTILCPKNHKNGPLNWPTTSPVWKVATTWYQMSTVSTAPKTLPYPYPYRARSTERLNECVNFWGSLIAFIIARMLTFVLGHLSFVVRFKFCT